MSEDAQLSLVFAPATKRCRRCKDVKPLDAFRPAHGMASGRYATCRSCQRGRVRGLHDSVGPHLPSTADRFALATNRDGPVHPVLGTACWLWTGRRSRFGYGLIRHNWRNYNAHTIAWRLKHGDVPAGICVLHRCDNPPCVRVDHLFLGTKGDNNRDCVAKGRHRYVPPGMGRGPQLPAPP